jgi:RNA polymerase sigma factor (sigma-70 family)
MAVKKKEPVKDPLQADDRALVEGLIQGNPWAWEELARRYGGLLTRTCTYYFFRKMGIAQAHDVENAVQQLLQALYKDERRALRSFRWRSRFSTWLVAVTHRTCSKILRAENRVPVPVGAPLPVDTIDQRMRDGEMDLPVSMEELCLALRTLPARHALLLKLIYFDGITYREAASIMGIRHSSVPTLLNRAKKRLKIALLTRIAV